MYPKWVHIKMPINPYAIRLRGHFQEGTPCIITKSSFWTSVSRSAGIVGLRPPRASAREGVPSYSSASSLLDLDVDLFLSRACLPPGGVGGGAKDRWRICSSGFALLTRLNKMTEMCTDWPPMCVRRDLYRRTAELSSLRRVSAVGANKYDQLSAPPPALLAWRASALHQQTASRTREKDAGEVTKGRACPPSSETPSKRVAREEDRKRNTRAMGESSKCSYDSAAGKIFTARLWIISS